MEYQNYRISKLREYLFGIVNVLANNNNYQINANMLSNKVGDYSLDKVPTESMVDSWIIGGGVHRDIYSFRSRKTYSQDTINNLKNIGFFEEFEKKIKSNNEKGDLPEINGIESIECLNSGTMISNDDGKTGTFDIQIQITYREE